MHQVQKVKLLVSSFAPNVFYLVQEASAKTMRVGKKFLLFLCSRALRVPITSRMLSDILSRLVETIAEQGEDMQVSSPINISRLVR